ncbi:FAD/NAD(P)-binding domain-containing protein [Ramaria rubella]|nr:FAD/NAD(P)-binding domain-containing protein [Ramaria rubella]
MATSLALKNSELPTVVISGGSLSGLMIAIVLKDLGYSVTVLERFLTVESQGAGIVLGRWSSKFFEVFDKTETEIGVPALRRQFFNKDGTTMMDEKIELRMTSWDKLYYTLRANFDGLVQDGYIQTKSAAAHKDDRTNYFMGCTVLAHSYDTESQKVDVAYRDKEGCETHIMTDLFVCAEGASSSSREIYFPKLPRSYSGYLAFRGLVPEIDLDPETAKSLVHSLSVSWLYPTPSSFTNRIEKFIHAKDSQFLCYTIPGPRGSTIPGGRYMNFVWYNTYPEGPHLEKVMTDKDGKRHPYSVSTGSMAESVIRDEIHPRAQTKLSPQCLDVVMKTKYPFVQLVTDVISPAAVFHDGHVLLVGDALSGARPHTTASTNQAADHALRLHAVLGHDPRDLGSLAKTWEPESLRYAKHLWDIGTAIGNLSQFEDHPMSVERESQERPFEEWMKVGEPK